ncbi:hypothetical protein [Embleya scabrispora]|uniref:hypothetical protein n=1 Tax=Embleya scabrispora TaxID=159449 RepID=UPI00037DAAE6|nr:hypothetical protein [Embleya scabrispora]MYS81400.1 hypothetical protein [Streptomyces sp. SID5474]
MTTYSLPRDLEEQVVRLLYQRAAELNWAYLPDYERTRQYRSWTADPAIGGRLLAFIGKPEDVRPWIKDGPMKEYARATYGVGKYAPLVAKPATPVGILVSRALDSGWIADLTTLDIKPLKVTIRREDDEEKEQRFAWGPAKDFKHLTWAAITAQANGDSLPWVVCLVDSFVRPVSKTQKAAHQRIAERVRLVVTHVSDG